MTQQEENAFKLQEKYIVYQHFRRKVNKHATCAHYRFIFAK